jgi:DNA-binding transcriptional LysR family regulator
VGRDLAGTVVAFLPRFVIVPDPELAVLAVTGADLVWPMSLATAADRSLSAAARALLSLIGGGAAAG